MTIFGLVTEQELTVQHRWKNGLTKRHTLDAWNDRAKRLTCQQRTKLIVVVANEFDSKAICYISFLFCHPNWYVYDNWMPSQSEFTTNLEFFFVWALDWRVISLRSEIHSILFVFIIWMHSDGTKPFTQRTHKSTRIERKKRKAMRVCMVFVTMKRRENSQC